MRYVVDFTKTSKKGIIIGKTAGGEQAIGTDHTNGNFGGKAMSAKEPLKFDDYKKNTYFFQYKIEVNFEDS